MISARLKLTVLYLAGLLLTIVVIAVSVSSAWTAGVYGDAGRIALANAELTLRLISQANSSTQPVLGTDAFGQHFLISRMKEQLSQIAGYVIVIDEDGNVQFTSRSVQALNSADSATIFGGIDNLPDGGPAGVIDLSADRVLLISLHVRDRSTGLKGVIAGVPVNRATAWPRELTTTMLVIIPLLIGLSTWVVWVVLGTTLRQIESIRREVAAITDGRSLHRRLSAGETSPELSALVATLNAMIARLETSFMALRRFTADASHELKTPLAVLRADVERAMNERINMAERMVALEEALHETTRMASLVENLLTLARADEGRFDLHREPVNLSELVQEVYETASILGEAAGVTVTLPFTTEVTISGDRARLRQLFLNLVTNAIKYTPAGGRVDLGLGRHPDSITFAVRDTGIGIAAAEVPHIFERFWRADRVRSRTSERGGFGLGLAISQWIVQAHGGTLTVSSRLGKGSLFTVTFPIEFINS
jgi:signal transduction histidine kinase